MSDLIQFKSHRFVVVVVVVVVVVFRFFLIVVFFSRAMHPIELNWLLELVIV